MLLFGRRPTIFLHNIYVNMLRKCSFTYQRGNLLTNRNSDRQTFVGIRKYFRDRSRGFAIFKIYLRPKVTLHYIKIYFFRVFLRDIRELFNSYLGLINYAHDS